jgi:hypothetical protein
MTARPAAARLTARYFTRMPPSMASTERTTSDSAIQ